MGLKEWITGPRPTGRPAGSKPGQENLEHDDSEGMLDPQTAALGDGAVPSSTSGRVTPSARRLDPDAGASETDTQHLPG